MVNNKENEKQEVEREEQVNKHGNNEAGNKPKEVSKIEEANYAAERLEKANEEAKRVNRETADLMVRKALSGEAEAGIITPTPVKETDEEYTERFIKGLVNPLRDDGFK